MFDLRGECETELDCWNNENIVITQSQISRHDKLAGYWTTECWSFDVEFLSRLNLKNISDANLLADLWQ